LDGQPDLQIIEDRGGMGTAKFGAAIRRRSPGLLLDSIELRDPGDGLLRYD
jgi:hypothetical protein